MLQTSSFYLSFTDQNLMKSGTHGCNPGAICVTCKDVCFRGKLSHPSSPVLNLYKLNSLSQVHFFFQHWPAEWQQDLARWFFTFLMH